MTNYDTSDETGNDDGMARPNDPQDAQASPMPDMNSDPNMQVGPPPPQPQDALMTGGPAKMVKFMTKGGQEVSFMNSGKRQAQRQAAAVAPPPEPAAPKYKYPWQNPDWCRIQ